MCDQGILHHAKRCQQMISHCNLQWTWQSNSMADYLLCHAGKSNEWQFDAQQSTDSKFVFVKPQNNRKRSRKDT